MKPLRLAMWSGPRNISTAMMRSWGNRSDTIVCDEPLYAHYLLSTGVAHPGREEILAAHETDWRRVADKLVGPLPPGKSISYQKHMAHHLLPDIDRTWLGRISNCFLIREPRDMLMSLVKVTPNATLTDTGLPQQVEILERVRDFTGATPPVIDARDVLLDPRALLTQLCTAVGVAFEDSMLHWPSGPRDTDGIWSKYWYEAVNRSTAFEPYSPSSHTLATRYLPLLKQCNTYYARLFECRLQAQCPGTRIVSSDTCG